MKINEYCHKEELSFLISIAFSQMSRLFPYCPLCHLCRLSAQWLSWHQHLFYNIWQRVIAVFLDLWIKTLESIVETIVKEYNSMHWMLVYQQVLWHPYNIFDVVQKLDSNQVMDEVLFVTPCFKSTAKRKCRGDVIGTFCCKNRQKRSAVQGSGQMQLFQINRTMTMFAEIVEASFTSVHTIAWRQFWCKSFQMRVYKTATFVRIYLLITLN